MMGTLESWELDTNWDSIKSKRPTAWRQECERAAERMNKEKLIADCMIKKRGELSYKTKTKTIVPLIENPEYVRKPQSFIGENNKIIARAYIMGRYGMLQCAANFSMGYATKECRACGVTDDEDHRINHCVQWCDINLSNSVEKINFTDIYSNDRVESLKVIERVMMMWDLGNGKNAMKTSA